MLYLFNHWSLLGLKEIPADLTCTSLPQAWNIPRGESITPEPVMKCTFVKPVSDKDRKRKLNPVSCKLYDARSSKKKWNQESILKMCEDLKSEKYSPPFFYLLSDQEASENVHTVFGNLPLGCVLGYQLTDLDESRITFYLSRSDDCILPIQLQCKGILSFPRLSCMQNPEYFLPPNGYSESHPSSGVNNNQSSI